MTETQRHTTQGWHVFCAFKGKFMSQQIMQTKTVLHDIFLLIVLWIFGFLLFFIIYFDSACHREDKELCQALMSSLCTLEVLCSCFSSF